jgi:hypothetical protein
VQVQPEPAATQLVDPAEGMAAMRAWFSCEQVRVTPFVVRHAAGKLTDTLPVVVPSCVYVKSAL